MRRYAAAVALAVLSAALIVACGGSPSGPTPGTGGNGGNGGVGGGGGVVEPPNTVPVIGSIAIQGTRAKEPANFADLGETLPVTATVTDAETAVDQLQFVWTATAGTFSGTGASVSWKAPSAAPAPATGVTPATVTITLTVIEKYGATLQLQNSTSKTAEVSLHDSVTEVGTMSRQFLVDFSDTNLKDPDFIMRNFKAAACPQPSEVQSERDDVVKNYTFYRMQNFRIDQPAVTVNFGGVCPFRGKRGDACAVVGVFWDSIDTRDNSRVPNAGNDIIAAAYSTLEKRWWLCASDYDGKNLLTGARISR